MKQILNLCTIYLHHLKTDTTRGFVSASVPASVNWGALVNMGLCQYRVYHLTQLETWKDWDTLLHLLLQMYSMKKSSFMKKFFTVGMVRHWNGLISEAVNAPSVEALKVRLDGALSTWLSCRHPRSLQGSWSRWPLSVRSNSNDSMIHMVSKSLTHIWPKGNPSPKVWCGCVCSLLQKSHWH